MTDEVDSHARETGESDGYVHDPTTFEEPCGANEVSATDERAGSTATREPRGRPKGGHGDSEQRGTEGPSGRASGDAASRRGGTTREPRGRGERAATEAGREPRSATGGDATDREFGWRGWVLVGFLLVAFVVVPVALYYVPRAQGFVTSLGLSLRDAYLVLPLVPALLLGALAVWATTRP